ncbi:MAG: P-loop NTPase family protein [Thermoplasmata archaeon]
MVAIALSDIAGMAPRPAEGPPLLPGPVPTRPRPGPVRRRAAARPLLPSAPAFFPWMAGRLADREATVWTGDAAEIEPLLELLYAGVVAAGGRISLLEGANRFDPYRIGEAARRLGVDPTHAVRRIRLARAFTAHQMVALADGWAAELSRHPATLLVAHDLPALFDDEEVEPTERIALLGRVADRLARTAERAGRPMVIVQPGGLARFPGLAEHGPRLFDYVLLERRAGAGRLTGLRDGARCALVGRPAGQHGLEEFGASEEVMVAWDAPPRRTGRRSRPG